MLWLVREDTSTNISSYPSYPVISNKQFQYCLAVCGDSSRWLLQQTVITIPRPCVGAHDNRQRTIPQEAQRDSRFPFPLSFQSEQLKQRLVLLCVCEADVDGQRARRADLWGGSTPLQQLADVYTNTNRRARHNSQAPSPLITTTRPRRVNDRQKLWTRSELSEHCGAPREEEVAVYCTGRALARARCG